MASRSFTTEKSATARQKVPQISLKAILPTTPTKLSERLVPRSSIGTKIMRVSATLKKARNEYRRTLRQGIAKLCMSAKTMSRSSEEWDKFRSDARLWKDIEPPAQTADILRTVIKLAVKNENRASLYYRAVKEIYETAGAAKEIEEAINKAGGFQKLADAQAQTNRQVKGSITSSQVSGQSISQSSTSSALDRAPEKPSTSSATPLLLTLRIFKDRSYELILPDEFYESKFYKATS